MQVIDTHTAGEPTRVIVADGPDLGHGSAAARAAEFAQHHDHYRRALINEPRGSDVMVGALLLPPRNERYVGGVIFFNNVGLLGMCGHGTIGVAVALAHQGRIDTGCHRLETPVGDVTFEYHGAGQVSIENVPCYRLQKAVPVEVPEIGTVVGDIAWGGNWFYLIAEHGQDLSLGNVNALTSYTEQVRQALDDAGITGTGQQEIDHVELFGPPHDSQNHSRNFVLCPGSAYDRSPCGTGTSAKLACLAADGKLSAGEAWRQESIVGSVFTGTYRQLQDQIQPTITGAAYVTAETKIICDPQDPFCWGITND